jgi:hypothetical protein
MKKGEESWCFNSIAFPTISTRIIPILCPFDHRRVLIFRGNFIQFRITLRVCLVQKRGRGGEGF